MIFWLPLSIISQAGLGLVSLVDKVILKNYLPQPLVYVFFIGAVSIGVVIFIPLGVIWPGAYYLVLAGLNGAAHLAAIYFILKALNEEEASRVLPFVGGLSPLMTFFIGGIFLNFALSQQQLIGFFLMVAATFLLTTGLNRWVSRQTLNAAIFSSFLFGINNSVSKLLYTDIGFVSGFFWSTLPQAFIALLIIWPFAKKLIKESTKKAGVKGGLIYWSNRGLAGLSSLGVSYAISLANPALVDSAQGVRYALIFLGSLLLTKFFPAVLKESWTTPALLQKFAALILIAGGLRLIV